MRPIIAWQRNTVKYLLEYAVYVISETLLIYFVVMILTRANQSWRYEIEKVGDKEDLELSYTHQSLLPPSLTILPTWTDNSILSL